MKDERLLEELKTRLDIVELISDYVELRRAGRNYKGLCPFHAEKTPSFMVSPEKQIFHCFGCDTGGNLIQFVMKYENLSFPEALTFLAKKAGITLKEFRGHQGGHDEAREKLLEILEVSSQVFRENLVKSGRATAYLRGRGLSEESLGLFSLGFALRDWHYLSHYLEGKEYTRTLLLRSGVVSSGEKGMYDTFRDRIMFPLYGMQGETIAFGGRVMDDAQPKYLNSPDTPLFRKGETLYDLHRAKEGIRKEGCALVVEGYFDVIICSQYGFHNAVAPLGTALTAGHLRKLRRFTKKAVLVFDGDEAGKSAARRSIPLLLEQGFSASILLLPPDHDPDSFLRKSGADRFRAELTKAGSAVDFLVAVSKADKTETVRETLRVISCASDTIMKEELIRELSEKTGTRETVIREEMKKMGKRPKEMVKTTRSAERQCLPYDEELLLLSAVIAFPEKLAYILQMVPPEQFKNRTVRSILERLGAAEGRFEPDSLLPSLDEEEQALVRKVTFDPGFDYEAVDKNIEDCIRKKVRGKFEERNKKAQMTGDREVLNALLLEKRRLLREEK
ncbi:MAG: DNA primase [Nitrospirae bacterium]|nr:DNA primase [Nitrospirota bacterium]